MMKQVMIGFLSKQVTVPQNMVQKVYRLQDLLTQIDSIARFMEANNLTMESGGSVVREKREQVLTLGKELDRLLKRIPTEVTDMLAKEVV
jgi:hypothetical protein